MRSAHDWGRAIGRPRTTSATVSRKSIYLGAIACTAAAALAACDTSPKNATNTNPTDPGVTTGPPNDGSIRTVVRGVAYPLVTVEPSTSVTMSVGQQSTFSARLNEPTGNAWTSCCSTWTSSDASVASVTTTGYGVADGERGIVVAHKPGTATISVATQSGTSGQLSVTVAGSTGSGSGSSGGSSSSGSGSSGSGSGGSGSSSPPPPPPSGSYHEPSGFARQISLPSITSLAAVSNFSPATTSSTGEWAGNLQLAPGGGLRIMYRSNLIAGGSPVRFGVSLASAGTGWYYQRMQVRFSSNWTNANNPMVKLCEPQTEDEGAVAGPHENHVISAFVNDNPANSYLTVLLQGPNSHYRDLMEQPIDNRAANLSDGNWHTMEVLFGPESTPGAGNGSYQAWVDGTQIAKYSDVLWLASGNKPGWPYLLFDPVYGGTKSSPPSTMYWDFNALYVSTR
jgi:hypothetical protein